MDGGVFSSSTAAVELSHRSKLRERHHGIMDLSAGLRREAQRGGGISKSRTIIAVISNLLKDRGDHVCACAHTGGHTDHLSVVPERILGISLTANLSTGMHTVACKLKRRGW